MPGMPKRKHLTYASHHRIPDRWPQLLELCQTGGRKGSREALVEVESWEGRVESWLRCVMAGGSLLFLLVYYLYPFIFILRWTLSILHFQLSTYDRLIPKRLLTVKASGIRFILRDVLITASAVTIRRVGIRRQENCWRRKGFNRSFGKLKLIHYWTGLLFREEIRFIIRRLSCFLWKG